MLSKAFCCPAQKDWEVGIRAWLPALTLRTYLASSDQTRGLQRCLSCLVQQLTAVTFKAEEERKQPATASSVFVHVMFF